MLNRCTCTCTYEFNPHNFAVVVGKKYEEPPTTDLQFPLPADLINYTRSENISTITIPPSLVQERLKEAGDGGRPYNN